VIGDGVYITTCKRREVGFIDRKELLEEMISELRDMKSRMSIGFCGISRIKGVLCDGGPGVFERWLKSRL